MARPNPFTPGGPAPVGMFIGRFHEIDAIDTALAQTKHGNPMHLLLLGERGIGKTSLLNVAQMFAKGEHSWGDQKHNFLSVRLQLDHDLCLSDFAVNLKKAIEREVDKENPEIGLLKKVWDFASRIEAAGLSYKREDASANDAQLIQNFVYSLVDTVKELKGSTIAKKKDGLVILLDEGDRAPKSLHLGAFLKNLSETLIAEDQNNILLILTGLPTLRDVLQESHESSLRLFQELTLKPLSQSETGDVLDRGLMKDQETSGVRKLVDVDALEAVYSYSEGYPHFVQQIGFSVFQTDKDDHITKTDVDKSFFEPKGALEMIGDRYFVKPFYTDIKVDSQREILRIMSEKWTAFVSRTEIKKEFQGNETALTNGIRALIEKGIILPKDGAKGQYRLQWASFAFWIRTHDRARHRISAIS